MFCTTIPYVLGISLFYPCTLFHFSTLGVLWIASTDALTRFFRPWYNGKITNKKSLDFSKRKAYNKYMKKAMTVVERETIMTRGKNTNRQCGGNIVCENNNFLWLLYNEK